MARPRTRDGDRRSGRRSAVPARDPATSAEYLHQKVRLVRATAEKVALQVARLRGELLPAAEVSAGWEAAIGRARSLLLGVPVAAAPSVLLLAKQHADDPAAAERLIRDYLTRQIDAALAELADTSAEDFDDEPEADADLD
jgi:phage terminase Nu1 subunit (DNA packaging protein)